MAAAVSALACLEPFAVHSMVSCSPPAITQSPTVSLPSICQSPTTASWPKLAGGLGRSAGTRYLVIFSLTASGRAGSLPSLKWTSGAWVVVVVMMVSLRCLLWCGSGALLHAHQRDLRREGARE